MSSRRLAEFSAVKIYCDLMSSPRLAWIFSGQNLLWPIAIATVISLAEFSAVKIYCELLSSFRLAENLAVNKNIGTMSSPRLAEFFQR